MQPTCHSDGRRDAVRRAAGRNGIDFIETGCDDTARTVYVTFLGKLPPELAVNRPGIERHLRIEGGDTITGLRVLDADPLPDPDPARDDLLVLTVDRVGDFSPYTLHLVDIDRIDPRYAEAGFRFRSGCPTGLDCKTVDGCAPGLPAPPRIPYLAKDYASFRQLILDRMALTVPGWTERHVPDLGITLVELLAYVGDQLSYQQDAVATEAYLGTARQRISVRRHARLVDYALHEGCNARAWVHLRVRHAVELPSDRIAFATGLNPSPGTVRTVWSREDFDRLPSARREVFEPLLPGAPRTLAFRPAHNEIRLYTWGGSRCCLSAGSTRATLLDRWVDGDGSEGRRALDLRPGDALLLEDVRGARTGDAADADPARRWVVRLTQVNATEDTLFLVPGGGGEAPSQRPTPLIDVEWDPADALPFPLCLSALGGAPGCERLDDVSVARGNLVLADHGRRVPPEPLGAVPSVVESDPCGCEGDAPESRTRAGRYRPRLGHAPLVFSEPLPEPPPPASRTVTQDPRGAAPALSLSDSGGSTWVARPDLLASRRTDRHLVAEIDNRGFAHLRFGDGQLGCMPTPACTFDAHYRTGGGAAGNVGAESIAWLVLDDVTLGDGVERVRNPLAAGGGIDPEPLEDARLFAPAAFRRQIERAIVADDYAALAQRHPSLQRATARFVWTGSWFEADVVIDPLAHAARDAALPEAVRGLLHRYRRIGHDVHVLAAESVPIDLALRVCALPGYEPGQVKAALLDRFSNRSLPGGTRGWFHPDELSLGDDIHLSRLVGAAQAVPGVECVTVTRLQRRFAPANRELANGVLPLAAHEVARLDNDPGHPEHGRLEITVGGGR